MNPIPGSGNHLVDAQDRVNRQKTHPDYDEDYEEYENLESEDFDNEKEASNA